MSERCRLLRPRSLRRRNGATIVGEPRRKGPDVDDVPSLRTGSDAAVAGGRLDVDRVLIAERAALHADAEPELLDVPGQVGEGEAGLLAFVAVEKIERLEVAQKLVAGTVPFGQRVEVRAGLLASGGQVAAAALLFDQRGQNSR